MTAPAGVYVRLPVGVRAIQYTGGNLPEVSSFHGRDFAAEDTGRCGFAIPLTAPGGTVWACCGWWIAEDPDGQLSAISPDDFAANYQLQEEQPA